MRRWFIAGCAALSLAGVGALVTLAATGLRSGTIATVASVLSIACIAIALWVLTQSGRSIRAEVNRVAGALGVSVPEREVAHTLAQIEAAHARASSAERDASSALALWRSMLDAVSEPVLALSAEGVVTWCNPAASRLFERSGGLIGTPIDALFTQPAMLDLHASAVRGDGRSERVRVVLPAGSRVLEATAVPLPAVGAVRHDVLMTVRDVTTLDVAVQVKTDFVANASHELRTPISAIRTAADTLEAVEDEDDPELRARLRTIIKNNVARLEELVRDLLDLSRLESSEFRPRIAMVPIEELEGTMRDIFREELDRRSLRLVFDTQPDARVLRTDRSLLNLVVKNLVENSTKFANENSDIIVRTTRQGADIIIEVIDEGVGIPLSQQDRIFERFYQVDSARTPGSPQRGTGLGLAIVKHAVRALGGEVSVRSVWGQGTTMFVELDGAAVDGPLGMVGA